MANPMTPQDAGFTIRKLQETIASQNAMLQAQSQENTGNMAQLAQAISEQAARLEQFTRAVAHSRVAGGEDIPGPRLPRFYTVSVPLTSGSTASATGEAIITNDGPFLCYAIAAFYLPSGNTGTTATFTNHYLPVSTAQLLVGLAALSATTAGVGFDLLAAVPDLSFKIEVAGSGRSWTPNVTEVPGGMMFGPLGVNELKHHALVSGGERIVVTVKPERAMPNTGTCRIVFQGYQVLTNQPTRY